MRLIDADGILDIINNENYPDYQTYSDIFDVIDSAPTIEAEPVRHGKWIKDESKYSIKFHCSVCGEDAVCDRNAWGDPEEYFRTDFCPNCGAKMEIA